MCVKMQSFSGCKVTNKKVKSQENPGFFHIDNINIKQGRLSANVIHTTPDRRGPGNLYPTGCASHPD